MTRIRTAGVAFGAIGLAFAAITLFALEGSEVVVLTTTDAAGATRATRTWIGDDDGAAWIEAANPERPLMRDLQANPRVHLQRHGQALNCEAIVTPNPAGHERIRRLLAAKYGWRDWWIGQLTDTSGSLALRLTCR